MGVSRRSELRIAQTMRSFCVCGARSERVHKRAYHLERLCGAHSAEAAVRAEAFYREKRERARYNARRGAADIAILFSCHVNISFLKVCGVIVCKFRREYSERAQENAAAKLSDKALFRADTSTMRRISCIFCAAFVISA